MSENTSKIDWTKEEITAWINFEKAMKVIVSVPKSKKRKPKAKPQKTNKKGGK